MLLWMDWKFYLFFYALEKYNKALELHVPSGVLRYHIQIGILVIFKTSITL